MVDPEDIEARAEALVGEELGGRYRLDAVLGIGAMGAVYRAFHTGLEREVAVKLLHRDLMSSDEMRTRFSREAAAISKLDHPNCVRVSDYGSNDDYQYLVMELLEGQSLGDALYERGEEPLPLPRAMQLADEVLAGIEHAHEHGLVHRDIKPDNIFLADDGEGGVRVKLLDFGIVKLQEQPGQQQLTKVGMVFGTPHFMSPEQAMGATVDARTDLYAIGVVFYTLLAGHQPFESDDPVKVLRQQIQDPPPPLSDDIPAALRELVERLLAKDPDQRHPSATAVRRDLAEIRSGSRPNAGPAIDVSAVTEPGSISIPSLTKPGAATPATAGRATAPTPGAGTSATQDQTTVGRPPVSPPGAGTTGRAVTPTSGAPTPAAPKPGVPSPGGAVAPTPGAPPPGAPTSAAPPARAPLPLPMRARAMARTPPRGTPAAAASSMAGEPAPPGATVPTPPRGTDPAPPGSTVPVPPRPPAPAAAGRSRVKSATLRPNAEDSGPPSATPLATPAVEASSSTEPGAPPVIDGSSSTEVAPVGHGVEASSSAEIGPVGAAGPVVEGSSSTEVAPQGDGSGAMPRPSSVPPVTGPDSTSMPIPMAGSGPMRPMTPQGPSLVTPRSGSSTSSGRAVGWLLGGIGTLVLLMVVVFLVRRGGDDDATEEDPSTEISPAGEGLGSLFGGDDDDEAAPAEGGEESKAPGEATDPEDASSLSPSVYTSIDVTFAAGEYSGNRISLLSFIKDHPEDAQLHWRLARVLVAEGGKANRALALDHYAKALGYDPSLLENEAVRAPVRELLEDDKLREPAVQLALERMGTQADDLLKTWLNDPAKPLSYEQRRKVVAHLEANGRGGEITRPIQTALDLWQAQVSEDDVCGAFRKALDEAMEHPDSYVLGTLRAVPVPKAMVDEPGAQPCPGAEERLQEVRERYDQMYVGVAPSVPPAYAKGKSKGRGRNKRGRGR